MATEKSALTEAFTEGYSLESHCKLATPPQLPSGPSVHHPASNHQFLVDYQPLKLSTFRVFCSTKGTIIKDPVLFLEQILLTLVFAASAAPVYIYFRSDVDQGGKSKDINVSRWLREQEGKMRAFAMIMTNLAAFLLTFYTSISVARWWTMRSAGIGGIKTATLDLEWLVYQNVTQEEEVLSAIRRYGRTSMILIFLWRQGLLGNMKNILVERELLTEHEADKLASWNHCLHETIWAWQGGIITMLRKEGKIKSDELFDILLRKCMDGRAAVQLVHTHLAVRIPMQYVHVLGLLVKMHNVVLAVIMGALFGAAVKNNQVIICVQTFGRTLILPFLFNAILLINAEISDPFNGSETDFPGMIYQEALGKDCQGFINASKSMPNWALERSTSKAV